jgi:hypothetical protein
VIRSSNPAQISVSDELFAGVQAESAAPPPPISAAYKTRLRFSNKASFLFIPALPLWNSFILIRMDQFNTPWRVTAAAIYTAPTDSRVYGTLDIDVTDASRFIPS